MSIEHVTDSATSGSSGRFSRASKPPPSPAKAESNDSLASARLMRAVETTCRSWILVRDLRSCPLRIMIMLAHSKKTSRVYWKRGKLQAREDARPATCAPPVAISVIARIRYAFQGDPSQLTCASAPAQPRVHGLW